MIFVIHLPIFDLTTSIRPQFIPALAMEGESADNTMHLILQTASLEQAKIWTLWFCVHHQIGTDDIDLLMVDACYCQLGIHLKQVPHYFSIFDLSRNTQPCIAAYYWPKNEYQFHSERIMI